MSVPTTAFSAATPWTKRGSPAVQVSPAAVVVVGDGLATAGEGVGEEGVETFKRGLERGQPFGHLRAEAVDRLVQVVDMRELLRNQ